MNLLNLPDGVLDHVLGHLSSADLAPTRQSCKHLARLASKQVTSTLKRRLSHRELLEMTGTFSNLAHLTLSSALSARCAGALLQLRSLDIGSDDQIQSIGDLSSMSELVALRVRGPVRQLEKLPCLQSLTKLCLTETTLPARALMSLTRLQSLAVERLEHDFVFCDKQRLGLSSVCLPALTWGAAFDEHTLAAVVQLSGLQVLKCRLASYIPASALSALRGLHALHVNGLAEPPACTQLTYLRWDCPFMMATRSLSLLQFTRLKELHCCMNTASSVCVAFPHGLTSLWFVGWLSDSSQLDLQAAVSQLLALKALRVRGPSNCAAASLLYDSVNFMVAADAAPLDACDIQFNVVSGRPRSSLMKGNFESLLSQPRFADSKIVDIPGCPVPSRRTCGGPATW